MLPSLLLSSLSNFEHPLASGITTSNWLLSFHSYLPKKLADSGFAELDSSAACRPLSLCNAGHLRRGVQRPHTHTDGGCGWVLCCCCSFHELSPASLRQDTRICENFDLWDLSEIPIHPCIFSKMHLSGNRFSCFTPCMQPTTYNWQANKAPVYICNLWLKLHPAMQRNVPACPIKACIRFGAKAGLPTGSQIWYRRLI